MLGFEPENSKKSQDPPLTPLTTSTKLSDLRRGKEPQSVTIKHKKTSELGTNVWQPWLRDLAPVDGASYSGGGGPTQVMQTVNGSEYGMNGQFLCTNEADLEYLVQYEEERERIGHFECIFPNKRNIDTYRPYFSQQRRSNIILWAYIK